MSDAAAAARSSPRLGLFLLAGITLVWGVNWPAMKLAVAEVPVWTFRSICLASGGFGLLAIARLGGHRLRIPAAEFGPLLLTAAFNITGWHLASGFGLVYLEAGRASIIAFTMPLWAAVLAVPLLGERLSRPAAAGLVVGLLGLAILVLPDWRGLVAAPLGVLFMLGAALSWAAGTVALKYFRWSMPTTALAGWQLLLGGVPVALGALWFDAGFAPQAVSATAWFAALYAALLPMIFCHWAWFKVVGLYPAAIAAIGTLAIPVVGVVSSAAVLGEPIGPDVVGALVLVLAALALVLIVPARRRP
ncbi:MAG: DMT family transporter [Dongiaceae bacterium]